MSVRDPAAIIRRRIADITDRGLIEVVERHAQANHVSVTDVVGPSKTASIVRARHAAWSELRATTKLSLPELGDLFGRDHTTVMYGIRKARAEFAIDARGALKVI